MVNFGKIIFADAPKNTWNKILGQAAKKPVKTGKVNFIDKINYVDFRTLIIEQWNNLEKILKRITNINW